MEAEDQDSKNFNKILDFVRSQKNGLEANSDDEVETRNAFDYTNIASLPEGEDSQTPSNFFSLLSKALPIEQINKMLQQELERRRKALSSYQVKCNEADYLLPKLTAQENALNTKLKALTEDIKINSERLEQANSKLNCYRVEEVSLDREIDQARSKVKLLKRNLECCDKIQNCVQKLCNKNNHALSKTPSLMENETSFNAIKHTSETSSKTVLVESSLTTDNTSFVANNSPAKSHTSEHVLHSTSSDSVSVKNEISLSEGEIVDDSECGSDSVTSSETDEI